MESSDKNGKLEELRKAFDDSFAMPEKPASEPSEKMLTIRAGDGHFVVRLSEISGVEPVKKIVKLPTTLPCLVGIAGVRRQVLAVYGLGALLGMRQTNEPPRWLLMASASANAIAFAIEELEEYTEVASSRIHSVEGKGPNDYVYGIVAEGEHHRPLLLIPRICEHVLRVACGETSAGGNA